MRVRGVVWEVFVRYMEVDGALMVVLWGFSGD